MNMNFYMSARIITGKNCVLNNVDKFKEQGNSCLIVTGEKSAKKSGALADVLSVLDDNNSRYIIFDKIQQNPTVESCIKAGITAREFGADYIIGIGGGSPLDASKAIAVVAANENITENELYAMNWKNKPLNVIAVGTTAGTGSEVTGVSVLTNCKGLKKSFRNDLSYPVCSFGDAKYTMTLSDSFTRSTAVDALAHCVESYFNRNANDMSKVFALAGIKKLISVFNKIISESTNSLNYDDREELYNASLLGGLAISITGTAFPHALGYFLTENYGLAHGTACAAFVPEFIEYNSNIKKDLTDELFNELRMEKEELIDIIKKITPEYNVTLSDSDIKELSPRWENNTGLKRTWGKMNTHDVELLLKKLFQLEFHLEI